MPNVRYAGLRSAAVWAIALLMTTVAWSQPMSTVTGVKVSQKSGVLNVDVAATGRVQHRSKVLTSPQKFIVVDVFPAKLKDGVPASTAVNNGLVEKIRVAQYTENTVRIYVDVISPPEFKVITASDAKGLTVAINANKMASGETQSAPTAAPAKVAAQQPKAPVSQPAQVAKAPVHSATPAKTVVVKSSAFAGQGTAPVSALRARQVPKAPKAPPQKLVTLDFVNADLVYVLKVLAKEMGRNIYVGPTVQGSVTVTLKNVPVEGAMALILQMQESEYDYKILDGSNPRTVIVAPPDKLSEIADDIMGKAKGPKVASNAPRMEYLLEEAPSAKVVDFLKGEYPAVEFTPHPTMNGFYARGPKEDLLQIKRELGNLDRVPAPPPPPLREFLSVKYGDINEVRTLMSTLVPDVTYNVDTRLNLLIAEGTPGAIDQAKELLAEIDRPLDQVMIDLKVVDISDNGTKNLGVTWTSDDAPNQVKTTFSEYTVGQTQVKTSGGAVISYDPTGALAAPAAVPIAIGNFARTPLALAASIQFLVSQNEAKILAAPRVASLSGQDALIHIGDKYPIVYFDPRAGQFQVQYVDIGIKLDVNSTVKADGYVVIDVRPEVSTLLELINNQYPRTAVRVIQTKMRVKDGDTIIIGGLIREEDIQNVTKVPLLGDLPILGTLFRSTNVTKNRNEVVLMMTPNIMR